MDRIPSRKKIGPLRSPTMNPDPDPDSDSSPRLPSAPKSIRKGSSLAALLDEEVHATGSCQ
jgi:hypothetical protein